MSNAMFHRTGAANTSPKLKVLITGEPKTGKTSFLGTVPNIVILDTEPHANNLESLAHLNVPYSTITSRNDLDRIRMVLGDPTLRNQAAQSMGMQQIEAVAIDTLDTLQGILKKERMREQRTSKFLRDDWGWLKEEMIAIVESFTALDLHVFLMVHSKTKEIGTTDDPRSIILPGLEGAISESIAGMVGYSMLSFRKQDIQPDGTTKTRYYLRAEGDEVYGFLGNRAAGRLPDIIDPDFATLLKYGTAARAALPAPAAPVEIQVTGTTPSPVAARGADQVDQTLNQQSAPAPAAPAAPVAPPQAEKPADDEPVNAAALSHIKKVYDEMGEAFPEDLVKTKTLGDARQVVKMWAAIKQDQLQGKLAEGETAKGEMLAFLYGLNWVVTEEGEAAPEAPEAVVPDVNGTIEQVMAYVGEDLTKVQEAYDIESAKDKPRAGLITKLTSKGAKVQTPVENQAAPDAGQPAAASAPAATEPAVQEAPAEVTPAATTADASPTGEQAVETVKDVLDGEVVDVVENEETRPCEKCGKAADDLDIARLSQTRFGAWLCVEHYIERTRS